MFRAPVIEAPIEDEDAWVPLREDKAPAPPRPRRSWRLFWRLTRLTIILAVWAALLGGGALLWFARDLPRPEDALDAVRRPSLVLRDQAGGLVATYGDVVGDPLRLSDLPPYLPAAAVSVEDRRFWSHSGFDLIGIARAVVVNLTSGRLRQGGSTITQQVAKNLFLSNARTLRRKVQEVLLTLWLERHFTKAEILEIWLNRVYLGSGAWGVDAGTRLYFGVSARHVSLWQAAMLAGIPRAPSRFNPRADPDAAAARAREVLDAMQAAGAITKDAADAARAAIRPIHPSQAGGWFADWAAAEAAATVPQGADITLRTTLDPRLQATAERAIHAILDGQGARAGASQAAAVVLDANTGAVRALVGGRDYAQGGQKGGFNRATAARRQPGSAFKPFVFLTAIEAGMRPDDTVLDAPLRIGTWSPVDFEPGFRGTVTLEQALADSLNTAAVRLEMRVGGPRAVAATAHRLGLTAPLPELPSLALGTGEVGLLDLTAAYAPFFNGGHLIRPRALLSATADGAPFTLPTPPPPRAVVDPDHAAMVLRMMRAVVTGGTGRAAGLPGRFVAGKTGTTQDNRDAWFVGGIDGNVIGVWVGNDDGTPMRGVMGGGLPAQIFREIARVVE